MFYTDQQATLPQTGTYSLEVMACSLPALAHAASNCSTCLRLGEFTVSIGDTV
jgi:hypothetical protein